jgi:hypothetical protein
LSSLSLIAVIAPAAANTAVAFSASAIAAATVAAVANAVAIAVAAATTIATTAAVVDCYVFVNLTPKKLTPYSKPPASLQSQIWHNAPGLRQRVTPRSHLALNGINW